jgi:hypothetical protein
MELIKVSSVKREKSTNPIRTASHLLTAMPTPGCYRINPVQTRAFGFLHSGSKTHWCPYLKFTKQNTIYGSTVVSFCSSQI